MPSSVIMTQTSSIHDTSNDLIHLPFIQIQPLSFDESLLTHHYHWIIFSSKNAVRYFLPYLDQVKYDKVAVIGEKTRRFCGLHDIFVDFCPDDYSQEGFLAAFSFNQDETIFIPSSAAARPLLENKLAQRGAKVTKVDLYRPVQHKANIEKAIQLLRMHQAEGIAFASSSSADNFFNTLKQKHLKLSFSCYAIGQPTYDTIHKYGYDAYIAKIQTIDGLINTIKESRNHK